MIKEYIERHTPKYLNKDKPSAIYGLFKWASGFFVGEIQGKENLPAGPKLFIANHREEKPED